MKKIDTRNLIMVALLSAISFALFMWEIKIVGPLEFDLSDVVVVMAGFWMGLIPGILVALIKNILHLLFFIGSGGIGELTNFVYAVLLMAPLALIKPKTWVKRIGLYILVIVFVTVSINVFNYYIAMPIYGIAQDIRFEMILLTFVPFNIVKTGVVILIFNLILPFFDRKFK